MWWEESVTLRAIGQLKYLRQLLTRAFDFDGLVGPGALEYVAAVQEQAETGTLPDWAVPTDSLDFPEIVLDSFPTALAESSMWGIAEYLIHTRKVIEGSIRVHN